LKLLIRLLLIYFFGADKAERIEIKARVVLLIALFILAIIYWKHIVNIFVFLGIVLFDMEWLGLYAYKI
jgi:hypothetical protein